MARRPVKLSQVALYAGVSESTASLAMRGVGRVSPETRERVRRVAANLGYSANPAARALREGAVPVIGVLTDKEFYLGTEESPRLFFPILITAMADELARVGIAVTLIPRIDREFMARIGVSGLFTLALVDEEAELADLPTDIPVLCGGVPQTHEHAVAYVDHEAAVAEVMDHLIGAGATTPALLITADLPAVEKVLAEGYRAWCQRQQLRPLVLRVEDESNVSEAVNSLIEAGADGLYTYGCTDKVRQTVAEAGRTISEDFLLVAFGEGIQERTMTPSVTTMSYLGVENAHLVADELEAMIHRGYAKDLRCSYRLFPRESTRAWKARTIQ